ncbi:MAG: hypothetical protein U0Q03_22565 [Acidimicrobiales bacterium]
MAVAARQHALEARPDLPVRPLRPTRRPAPSRSTVPQRDPRDPRAPRAPRGATARRAPAPRVVATRRHGALADGPQPLVRATQGIHASERHLSLVQPRGRRVTHLAVVGSVLIGLAMLGAAAFQTQLAQRQVQLDQYDSDIRDAREQYETLRRQRAELRSPEQLATVAAANGMQPAHSSDVAQVSTEVQAIVAMSTGDIDPSVLGDGHSTLDDFREVKAITNGDLHADASDDAPDDASGSAVQP